MHNLNHSFSNHSNQYHGSGGILGGHGALASPLSRFLVQAIIIIGLSRLLHLFMRKLRQPRVIAEMVAGMWLGPSVLGNIPGFTETLFPRESLPTLSLVADIGLVFYLFLVGLELEPQVFFDNFRRSVFISGAGILLPFVGGAICSYGLYFHLPSTSTISVPFPTFFLFISVAMSITAFPILARILTEKKLLSTPVGTMAISAAALDDAAAWIFLALVISLINSSNALIALYVFLMATSFAALLLFPFRILLTKLFDRYLSGGGSDFGSSQISQLLIASIFVLLFVSSWITELIGIHAIFGAFIFGLAIPRVQNVSKRLTEKIEDVILIAFLPLFFASSGLKTNISLLNDRETWIWLAILLFVTMAGKIVGCSVMARCTGMNLRESLSIGVLMNAKGLVELIVLNIGYDAKIIDSRIFLIMTIVALITTFMTSPIISHLYPAKYHAISGLWPQHIVEHLSMRRSMRRQKSISIDNRLAPAIVHQSIDHLRLLIYLDDRNPFPGAAKFLTYLVSGNPDEGVLSLSALKVVEPTERSSSVIAANNINDVIKSDQSLAFVRLFSDMFNVQVRCLAAMSRFEEIGDEVNYVMLAEDCDFVLVTFNDQDQSSLASSTCCKEVIRKIDNSVSDRALVIYSPSVYGFQDETSGSRIMNQNFLAVLDSSQESYDVLRFLAKIAKCQQRKVSISILFLQENPNKLVERNPSKSTTISSQRENLGAKVELDHREENKSEETKVRNHFELLLSTSDYETHQNPVFGWKSIKWDENPWPIIAVELSLTKFELILIGKHFNVPDYSTDQNQDIKSEHDTLIRDANANNISGNEGEIPQNPNEEENDPGFQTVAISQSPLFVPVENGNLEGINSNPKPASRQISQLSKFSVKSFIKHQKIVQDQAINHILGNVVQKIRQTNPSLSFLVVSRQSESIKDEKF